MIIGAKFGMGDLNAIRGVARRLDLENKSLSETVDDYGNDKVGAVKRGFEDLVAKVEAYSNRMNWCASDYYQTLELNIVQFRIIVILDRVDRVIGVENDIISLSYIKLVCCMQFAIENK